MTLGEKRVDRAGLKPAPLTVWASALTMFCLCLGCLHSAV